jgi:hypothetical protein
MVSRWRDYFFLLGPSEYVPPEDRDRMQIKDRKIDNVQNRASYTNISGLQTMEHVIARYLQQILDMNEYE